VNEEEALGASRTWVEFEPIGRGGESKTDSTGVEGDATNTCGVLSGVRMSSNAPQERGNGCPFTS
jgi:hypothetical protein